MNIKEIKALIAEKEQELDTLKTEALELIEADKLEEAKEKETAIQAIIAEIDDLKKQLSDLENAEEDDGAEGTEENEGDEMVSRENRSIDTGRFDIGNDKVTSEEVRAFEGYLESRADIPGGSLTTESGFVVIPEEVVTEILKLKEHEYNLDKFVTVKSVKNGSGKYPVVRQSQVAALPAVEELAANPELAVKPFFQLAYDIVTHRGYFLISREAIEDSQINVLAELKVWMARTIAATRNQAIVNVLKNGGPGEDGPATTIPAETVSTVDEIKNAINLNILPNYEHNVAIVSKSAWAKLDTLKDKNGNYLIQPDIKDASVKRFLGARVEILPDEMLGTDGANTIVIGNLKDAVVLFERSQYQAGWTDYMHFGEALMVAVRQDVRLLDHKAAIVLTLDDAGVPAG